MSHSNGFVSFLRHYGPIPSGNNMYDELIQDEIDRYGIEPAIKIAPAKLEEVKKSLKSTKPCNVILTGTAGDGKTYHCREVWLNFGGDPDLWKKRRKRIVSLTLPDSGKKLTIVKDLSELAQDEKSAMLTNLASSVNDDNAENVFLVAANDGQLLASWRDWSRDKGEDERKTFKIVEDMLVEGHASDDELNLNLYNLSRLDASEHFQELVEQVVEHPQWSQCEGCELLKDDGSTTCPIRINRERLLGGSAKSVFSKRLGELMKLARANRIHIPIRDLLLLGVNILLGDRSRHILLTCSTAKKRVKKEEYRLTNPYANVFGVNLPERQRQQYQVFNIFESFGIGRETDNKFDNLLVYGSYGNSEIYTDLVHNDTYYGAPAYDKYLRDYLEGTRKEIDEFMQALSRQRQRLFFSISTKNKLDPWHLTVYQASGQFLEFVESLKTGSDASRTTELLVRGLNRTFCGMMIDDGTKLYLASSGGDGRGRIASLLDHILHTIKHRREPYLHFAIDKDNATPCMQVIDPAADGDSIVDSFTFQLTHFEYLIRVANGGLPASFSRQCNEDFLDFKLRLIKRLDDLFGNDPSGNGPGGNDPSGGGINLQALTVDDYGRVNLDLVRIREES